MKTDDFIEEDKLNDFLEDVQSLADQYGLDQEAGDHLKWVTDKLEDLEGRIHLYTHLIYGCETSIKAWKHVAKNILELKK